MREMLIQIDGPLLGLIVVIITINLWRFRAMVRLLAQHHELRPVIAPLTAGHLATLLTTLVLAIALNVGRWAPRQWSLEIRDFLTIMYTVATLFGLVEAVSYMTWLRGWTGLNKRINAFLAYTAGGEVEET